MENPVALLTVGIRHGYAADMLIAKDATTIQVVDIGHVNDMVVVILFRAGLARFLKQNADGDTEPAIKAVQPVDDQCIVHLIHNGVLVLLVNMT